MVYVTTLITVIVGILGVLFSKQGERAPIRPVGYLFMVLVVVSGMLSALDAYWKSEASADAQRKLVLENSAIKDQLTALRLQTFSLGTPPRYAVIVFDYTDAGAVRLTHKHFAGPLPNFGKKGQFGTIWVGMLNLFEINGTIETTALYGPPVEDTLSALITVSDSAKTNKLEKRSWSIGEMAPVFSVAGNLTRAIGKTSMRRLLADLDDLKPVAVAKLDKPSDDAVVQEAIAVLLRTVTAYIKFYVDLRTNDKDGCKSTLKVPLAMQVSNNPTDLTINFLPNMRGLSTSECEQAPF